MHVLDVIHIFLAIEAARLLTRTFQKDINYYSERHPHHTSNFPHTCSCPITYSLTSIQHMP
jgi:hypothetical protein